MLSPSFNLFGFFFIFFLFLTALGGNITSLNSAVKNGLGYLVCDTPNPDSEKLTAVGGVVRVRVI